LKKGHTDLHGKAGKKPRVIRKKKKTPTPPLMKKKESRKE